MCTPATTTFNIRRVMEELFTYIFRTLLSYSNFLKIFIDIQSANESNGEGEKFLRLNLQSRDNDQGES